MICKLRANAIAPLITPLYHIKITYFRFILNLKQLKSPIMKAGTKTPAPLAKIQESIKAKVNEKLNYEDSIENKVKPR